MYNQKRKSWVTPAGVSYDNYRQMLSANHLLVCGSTGSGKSVVLNHLIREICFSAPSQKSIVLLDPKRVDFNCYRNLPQVTYNNNVNTMMDNINAVIRIMEQRYREMEQRHIRKYDGSDIYLIIDEYADLHDVLGSAVENAVIRLCQLARAAKIHVILATQRATGCVSTRIRTNMDYKLCLHTSSARESKNVIECAGAETLPLYGYGIYCTPTGMETLQLANITDEQIDAVIRWWTNPAKCVTYC